MAEQAYARRKILPQQTALAYLIWYTAVYGKKPGLHNAPGQQYLVPDGRHLHAYKGFRRWSKPLTVLGWQSSSGMRFEGAAN
jgi:hypothetical protein